MSRSHISADPQGAAWDLWTVRALTRLSLNVSPRLAVGAVIAVALGGSLLGFAVVQRFGDQAASNVRAVPGFFGVGDALTNATHLVFACCLPLLATAMLAIVGLVGVASPDIAQSRGDRTVWQALNLSCREVLVSHEVLPRLPLLLLVWAPAAALLTLTELTSAERLLASLLLGLAAGIEVLRAGVQARRLSGPLLARAGWPAVLRTWLAWGLVGVTIAGGYRLLSPLWVGQDAWVAVAALWIVGHPAAATAAALALAGCGVVLLAVSTAGSGAFHDGPIAPPARATPVSRRLAGLGFPVAGPRWLIEVWCAPELGWAIVVLIVLQLTGIDAAGLPHALIGIVAVAGVMGFCVTRLPSAGVSWSIVRMRHHVELGAAPARLSLLTVLVSYLAAAPLLAAVATVLVRAAAVPPFNAVGVVLLGPIACLVADLVVATPGRAGLTDTRLLLLGLIQALLQMGGWLTYPYFPAVGWLLPLVLLGVFGWLFPQRLTRWRPRIRP